MKKRAVKKGHAFVSGLLLGMSATAMIGGTHGLDVRRYSSDGIESDWRAVGGDLRQGMRRYERENKEALGIARRKRIA